MIGTPFTSNNPIEQRKINRINKKPWEQEVRDDKGRRRFHGAFTGGFSAGYFNTVGSKEGWKPKDKYDREKKQNVMDFMDEEDIQLALGNNLITLKEVDKGKKEEDALDQLLGKINNDKFLMYIKDKDEILKGGEKIQCIASNYKIETKNNPYEFNYKRYLNSNKYISRLYCSKIILKENGKNKVLDIIYAIREYISKQRVPPGCT